MTSLSEYRTIERQARLSKAQAMPARARGGFLSAVRRMAVPQPCEYGHYECSTSYRGPCSDELLGLIECR